MGECSSAGEQPQAPASATGTGSGVTRAGTADQDSQPKTWGAQSRRHPSGKAQVSQMFGSVAKSGLGAAWTVPHNGSEHRRSTCACVDNLSTNWHVQCNHLLGLWALALCSGCRLGPPFHNWAGIPNHPFLLNIFLFYSKNGKNLPNTFHVGEHQMSITEVDSGRMVSLSGNEQKATPSQLSDLVGFFHLNALSSN